MNIIYQIILKLNALVGIRKFRLACYFFALMSLFYSCYNMAYNTQDVSDVHFFKNLMGKSYRLKFPLPMYEEHLLVSLGEFGFFGMPVSNEEYENHPTDWWKTEKYKIKYPHGKNRSNFKGVLPAGTVFKVYKVVREVYLGNVNFLILAEVNEKQYRLQELGVDLFFDKNSDSDSDFLFVPNKEILEELDA